MYPLTLYITCTTDAATATRAVVARHGKHSLTRFVLCDHGDNFRTCVYSGGSQEAADAAVNKMTAYVQQLDDELVVVAAPAYAVPSEALQLGVSTAVTTLVHAYMQSPADHKPVVAYCYFSHPDCHFFQQGHAYFQQGNVFSVFFKSDSSLICWNLGESDSITSHDVQFAADHESYPEVYSIGHRVAVREDDTDCFYGGEVEHVHGAESTLGRRVTRTYTLNPNPRVPNPDF